MKSNNTEVAELINRLFDEHRKPDGQMYSHQEVGNALGVHPSYIGKLRNGKVPNPGRDTLKQLCLFFQVPSSYFFPELGSLETTNPHGHEINPRSILRDLGLDEESQYYIEGLINRLKKKPHTSE